MLYKVSLLYVLAADQIKIDIDMTGNMVLFYMHVMT